MYFLVPYLHQAEPTYTAQGIAPTLISFRVTDEAGQNEDNSINQTGPLSYFAFRQTALHTNTNSVPPTVSIPVINFGAAHLQDGMNGVQTCEGVVTQENSSTGQWYVHTIDLLEFD